MDQSDKVIMDDIDELLEIPRFLDRRIPEIQKQFEERRKIEEASERRKGIYKRRKAEREAARLKMERDKLEAAKRERRELRERRKVNAEQRLEDRAIVLERIRALRALGIPTTVGQIEKRTQPRIDRMRVMSAIRWLIRNGRITTQGRRYVEC